MVEEVEGAASNGNDGGGAAAVIRAHLVSLVVLFSLSLVDSACHRYWWFYSCHWCIVPPMAVSPMASTLTGPPPAPPPSGEGLPVCNNVSTDKSLHPYAADNFHKFNGKPNQGNRSPGYIIRGNFKIPLKIHCSF